MVVVLSCHNAYGAACESAMVSGVRFDSPTSFTSAEEHYSLADIVRAQDGSATFSNDWVRSKTLKTEPSYKAEPDRYDRCSVVLRDTKNGHTLQYALVREGLAIGYNEKGYGQASALLKAEKQAHADKKGLWAKGDIIIQASDTPEHIGKFVMVEGVVKTLYNHKKGHVMLNFGEDWKTDFTVFIPNFSAKKYKKGFLNNLKDKKIQIRGILYEKNGPSLSVLNKNYLKILTK